MRALAPLMLLLSCAPAANGPSRCLNVRATLPLVAVEAGAGPVIITTPHSGAIAPLDGETCVELDQRDCTGLETEDDCQSGPCRFSTGDNFVDALGPALRDALAARTEENPTLIRAEVSRRYVDLNRDADDPIGGEACALGDPRARETWEHFHAQISQAILTAKQAHGARALLVDVHTFGNIAELPERLIMIGTGEPVGLTTPRLLAADPSLAAIFGPGGLRERLLASGASVLPTSIDDDIEPLLNGRYVVRHHSAEVDALQIEVSDPVRRETAAVAERIADGIAAYLNAR